MPTRPCEFCLALQGDSVFADFDVGSNGQLYLVRISFDGYGCCHPAWDGDLIKISVSESRQLVEKIKNNDVAQPSIARILKSYFVSCSKAVWEDALHEHELIDSKNG